MNDNLIDVNPDDMRPGGWVTNKTPQPELTEPESRFENIQGGAIDAFDHDGWNVVCCRVLRQLLDRAAGFHKNCVLVIGEPNETSDFVERLFKHPFALPEWKTASIPGLMRLGNTDFNNGWAGKSSWGPKDTEQMVKVLDSYHL